MNTMFLKSTLEEITLDLLLEVIEYSYTGGHTSFAPLGCSGPDYILFGESRRKEISLRLHSGTVKLLITDNCGGFLFYGGFDTSLLPIQFIAEQYFSFIQNVKHLLENTSRKPSISESDKSEMFKSRHLLSSLY